MNLTRQAVALLGHREHCHLIRLQFELGIGSTQLHGQTLRVHALPGSLSHRKTAAHDKHTGGDLATHPEDGVLGALHDVFVNGGSGERDEQQQDHAAAPRQKHAGETRHRHPKPLLHAERVEGTRQMSADKGEQKLHAEDAGNLRSTYDYFLFRSLPLIEMKQEPLKVKEVPEKNHQAESNQHQSFGHKSRFDHMETDPSNGHQTDPSQDRTRDHDHPSGREILAPQMCPLPL